MDAAGLGDVVRGLFLRVVGDVAGHGGGDDKRAAAALFEVVAHGFGAVEGAVQVCLDDFVPVLDGAIKDAGIGGTASVGDEAIDLFSTSIFRHYCHSHLSHTWGSRRRGRNDLAYLAEVLNDIRNELLSRLVIRDVELVGLGLDAVALPQLLGVFFTALGTRGIGDGDVGTEFSASSGGFYAHALWTRGTSHHDDFAFEAEEVEQMVGFRDSDRHDE